MRALIYGVVVGVYDATVDPEFCSRPLRGKRLLQLKIVVARGKRHQKLQFLHPLNNTVSIVAANSFLNAVMKAITVEAKPEQAPALHRTEPLLERRGLPAFLLRQIGS
jgi:hypothetical protein